MSSNTEITAYNIIEPKYDPTEYKYDPTEYKYDPTEYKYDPTEYKYDPTEADNTVATKQIFDMKKSQESAGLKYKLKYLKAKKDYYYK